MENGMEGINYLIPLFAVIAVVLLYVSHHYNTERFSYLLKIGGFISLICTSLSCYAAVRINYENEFGYNPDFDRLTLWVCVIIVPILCSLSAFSNWVDYSNSNKRYKNTANQQHPSH